MLPLLALLIACLSYGEANARGIVLVTSGDSITEVAPLDPTVAKEVEAELGPGVAVGYKYEQFGLFWVEIWSWEGKYVLYRGEEYWELPDADLAAAAGLASVDALSKPWTYSVPPGLVVIVLALLGFGAFAIFSKGEDEEDEEGAEANAAAPGFAAPAVDPRYQAALAAYYADPSGAHDSKMMAAVSLLGQYGIPPEHAYPTVMHMLAQQHAAQYGAGPS